MIKEEAIKRWKQTIPQPYEKVQPLVIRANVGDTVKIKFTHSLNRELSIHVQGLDYQVQTSDGASVGFNKDTTTKHCISYTWYAKREGVYLFHDMGDTRSSEEGTNVHGLFGAIIVEEAGATFHDIKTGEPLKCETKAVIKKKDGTSFREFALFVHDFALLFDKKNQPLNPPGVMGSHDDPGVMGINYRSEPMRERLKHHSDPAYIFSSHVHGDPSMPILETYPEDEMVIRLLDGAHEEQHCFNLTGMSWKKEIDDNKSLEVASQTLGISEAFNIRIEKSYGAGDYLYYFGGIDDAWLGLWGIIRVYKEERECLKPLCKGIKRMAPLPPCPNNHSKIRKYEIAAIQKKVEYNGYGDHDPDGLIFVPLEDVDQALCGNYNPKPLILRANAGDWIEVTLHNFFDPSRPIPYYDYPKVPLDKKHKPSMRVSLNPQFLHYDPISDSGINIGYNSQEQTVGVGESKKYLWYADQEYGCCLIQSFGDMRNHRYHGLFGAIVIEPAGASWYKNFSLAKGSYEEEAVIVAPGIETFRECVLFIQNGFQKYLVVGFMGIQPPLFLKLIQEKE